MALAEFWGNVWKRTPLPATMNIINQSRLNAEVVERVLREMTLWLTPRAVAGFDEADFAFLPDVERARLVQLVTEFRRVVSQNPPRVPPTEAQAAEALPLFRDLVLLLEFDRYGDAEAFALGKQIEREIEYVRPPELVELRFSTGRDYAGTPGIWIWAVLNEEGDAFLRRTTAVRELLSSASRDVAPDLFPFISFRSVADQAEAYEEEEAS